VNDDNVTHTVTATGLFNSGEIGHGLEFSYTFGSVGTYKYTLLENPSVNGTIIVMGPPGNWGDVGN
jgi:plastocyanin